MIVHFHGGPLADRKMPMPDNVRVGDTVMPAELPQRVGYGRYRVTELIYSTLHDGSQHFEYAEATWGD